MSPIKILDFIDTNGERYYEITDDAARHVRPKTFFISIQGNVYNKDTGYLQPIYSSADGYLTVSLATTHLDRKIFYIHRILMITFCYVPNYKYLTVNHKDGNKLNNSLYNLEWASLQRNNEHALFNNLIYEGENCPWALLDEQKVREICQILASKNYTTIADIARKYNYSVTTIGDIARGKTWKHISREYNLDYDVRDRFTAQEVHTICKIFAANKGKSFDYLYYLVLFAMGLPEDRRMKKRISKLYYRNPSNYYDITSQYDY